MRPTGSDEDRENEERISKLEDRENEERLSNRKRMLAACIVIAVVVLVAVIIIVFTTGQDVGGNSGGKMEKVTNELTKNSTDGQTSLFNVAEEKMQATDNFTHYIEPSIQTTVSQETDLANNRPQSNWTTTTPTNTTSTITTPTTTTPTTITPTITTPTITTPTTTTPTTTTSTATTPTSTTSTTTTPTTTTSTTTTPTTTTSAAPITTTTLSPTCGPGYRLTDSGCADIDECLTKPCMDGIHICENFPGSFNCICNSSAGFFSLPPTMSLNVPDRKRVPPCRSCGSYRLIPAKWSDRTDRDWTIHMWGEVGEDMCSEICACANGPCDMRTGQCPGKDKETRCLGHEESLFSESSQSCNNISDAAECFQAWGGFCERVCHCKHNEACKPDTGKCDNNECDGSYTGDFCHIKKDDDVLCNEVMCNASQGLMCTPDANLRKKIDAKDFQLHTTDWPCVCKDDLKAFNTKTGKCEHKLYKNCRCWNEAWCSVGVRVWDNPCSQLDSRLKCIQLSKTGYICAQKKQ